MLNKDVLLSKLLRFGISGRMIRFIHSFLSNRTFQVRLGSTLSLTKRLENGTPQGSVLSPILFSLMIIYLPERMTSPAALYADDFCFWECGSNITLLNQLCQRSLFKVCNWCEECGFKISCTKSNAVLFYLVIFACQLSDPFLACQPTVSGMNDSIWFSTFQVSEARVYE